MNVKKLLKSHSAEILPDERIKENIKRELASERVVTSSHGGAAEAAIERRRTPLVLGIVFVVVAAIFLGAFLPYLMRDRSSPFSVANKFSAIRDADSFYAYGAASVGTLIAADSGSAGITTEARLSGNRTSTQSSPLATAAVSDTVTKDINRYMGLVENLMSGEDIASESVAAMSGYEFGLTVRYSDLIGGANSFSLHYNKIDSRGDNYALEGVMQVGETLYPVEGRYETESEDGETESELFFTAFTSPDRLSYIEVRQGTEQESEDGETETENLFVYSVYVGGELVERTTAEYEAEDDETTLVLSHTANGITDRLKFEFESSGSERVIVASGVVAGEAVKFRVFIQKGQYRYVFEDGRETDLARWDDDDDDDDDDD